MYLTIPKNFGTHEDRLALGMQGIEPEVGSGRSSRVIYSSLGASIDTNIMVPSYGLILLRYGELPVAVVSDTSNIRIVPGWNAAA